MIVLTNHESHGSDYSKKTHVNHPLHKEISEKCNNKYTYELLLIIAGIASSLLLNILSEFDSDKLASEALINIIELKTK